MSKISRKRIYSIFSARSNSFDYMPADNYDQLPIIISRKLRKIEIEDTNVRNTNMDVDISANEQCEDSANLKLFVKYAMHMPVDEIRKILGNIKNTL